MRIQKWRTVIAAMLAIAMLFAVMLSGCGQSAPTTIRPTTLPISALPTTTMQPSSAATVPTEPTQPTTAPVVSDKPFPEELQSNLYLNWKNKGFCGEMVGTMMITVIFLSDTVSKWDSAGIANAKANIDLDEARLEADAASFGASLDVQITYLESNINLKFNPEDRFGYWAQSALRAHGLERAFYNQSYLAQYYNVDSAPVVFVVNQEGRAYAASVTDGISMEYAVLYSSETRAMRHELCHLYGAVDFYFPDEVLDAAKDYLPGSIMDDGLYGAVDTLTAFLIGWTDILSANAEAFLRATNHITQEYLDEAIANDRLTGYGTKRFENSTYTGYMVNGVPHGEGTCTWNNGDVYTGSWENGYRSGYGEHYYAYTGDRYVGEFLNGKRHGEGTYYYADGTVKSGRWENDVYVGA